MKVKSLSDSATKWSQRASQAGPAYTQGVTNPKQSWSANTVAAKDNWQQGVTKAAANNTFATSVAKAGDTAWQQGAINKGAPRYTTGVTGPIPIQNYTSGSTRSNQILASLTLPPRMPKGAPQNQLRSTAVQVALHEGKTGGQ